MPLHLLQGLGNHLLLLLLLLVRVGSFNKFILDGAGVPTFFFKCGTPIAGILFSGHLKPIFLYHLMLIYCKYSSKKKIRTTSCSSKTADHSILPFDLQHHKRNKVLYKSSPGFEPTSSSELIQSMY